MAAQAVDINDVLAELTALLNQALLNQAGNAPNHDDVLGHLSTLRNYFTRLSNERIINNALPGVIQPPNDGLANVLAGELVHLFGMSTDQRLAAINAAVADWFPFDITRFDDVVNDPPNPPPNPAVWVPRIHLCQNYCVAVFGRIRFRFAHKRALVRAAPPGVYIHSDDVWRLHPFPVLCTSRVQYPHTTPGLLVLNDIDDGLILFWPTMCSQFTYATEVSVTTCWRRSPEGRYSLTLQIDYV